MSAKNRDSNINVLVEIPSGTNRKREANKVLNDAIKGYKKYRK